MQFEILPGTLIRKINYRPFRDTALLKVDSVRTVRDNQLQINGKYTVYPENVKVLTSEEWNTLNQIWNDCTIKEHVQVDGRIPCLRADGTSKHKLNREEVQAKLFELRMTRRDMSFEAYECPQCGTVHIGRNPYLSKDVPEGI